MLSPQPRAVPKAPPTGGHKRQPNASGKGALDAVDGKGAPPPAPPPAAAPGAMLKGAGAQAWDAPPRGDPLREGGGGEEPLETGMQMDTLDELHVPSHIAREVQEAWQMFTKAAGSSEAVGKLVYEALFQSAPTLQSLFTTAQAVQAMRFAAGIQDAVLALHNPPHLKAMVEALSFRHLNIDVSLPNAAIFRNALLELLEDQLDGNLSRAAYEGMRELLNYMGGAMGYVRKNYSQRLLILKESWEVASGRAEEKGGKSARKGKSAKDGRDGHSRFAEKRPQDGGGPCDRDKGHATKVSGSWRDKLGMRKSAKRHSAKAGGYDEETASNEGGGDSNQAVEQLVGNKTRSAQQVPRTFNEMFSWNAQVMGFGGHLWLGVVLQSLDTVVTKVDDPTRLQQECDVMALKISKVTREPVNLAEFKSCMLASLRSLLPKTWDSNYEVAWNWLWDNVEKLLRKNMGNPPRWEQALTAYYDSLSDDSRHRVRRCIYDRFFEVAPMGQEYFKQSDTRLHYIAEKMLQMTQEIYQDPTRMVDDISALGLRHVGYAIPTELVGPFTSCAIEVVNETMDDDVTMEAFRWSISLIAQMLVGTIKEGSTVVMRAINANSAKALKAALTKAPRSQRALGVLRVQVGTQSISPLEWALSSGSHEAAAAIIEDLLTIRADRDRYYYGVDELFAFHPNIVSLICDSAPSLINCLFDGLVWRSRFAEDGLRRANYYIKHLLVDKDGHFSDTLKNLVKSQDPVVISHPVIILVSDTLWSNIVMREFILSKVWFIASLAVFMLGIVLLPKTSWSEDRRMRWVIFSCRLTNYTFTMGRLILEHLRDCFAAYRKGDTVQILWIPIPRYLTDPYRSTALILGLLLACMCSHEPMIHCIESVGETGPTEDCLAAEGLLRRYSIFCMFATMLHWGLLIDLAVFSTGLSAFVLVIVEVLSEIGRFILVMVFLLLTSASAIVVLEHSYTEFDSVWWTMVGLYSITVRLYEDDYRNLDDAALIGAVFLFVTCSAVILLNLLIAQLNQSYNVINNNSIGYARLKRAEVIVETMRTVSPDKWAAFLQGLKLDEPLEFSQGDLGMGGGIQRYEPSFEHVVSTETIKRYGGSAQDVPWPEEQDELDEDDQDPYERIERLAELTLKRLRRAEGGKQRGRRRKDASGTGKEGSSFLSSSMSSHTGGSTS